MAVLIALLLSDGACQASTVQFGKTAVMINEIGEGILNLPIEFSPDAPASGYSIRVIGGSAKPGEDFLLNDLIAGGLSGKPVARVNRSSSLYLYPVDDGLPENEETVVFAFSTLPEGTTLGPNTNLVVTIQNGPARIVVSSDQSPWQEPEFVSDTPGPILSFSRQGDTNSEVTAAIELSGRVTPGEDFQPLLPKKLLFPAGSRSPEGGQVQLNIRDGRVDAAGIESLVITLRDAKNSNTVYSEAVFTIQDRESPTAIDADFRPPPWVTSVSVFDDGRLAVFDESVPDLIQILSPDGKEARKLPTSLRAHGFARQFGSIIMAGWDSEQMRFSMRRLSADGTFDPSFQSSAILTAPIYQRPYITVGGTGVIYILGEEGIFRFTADGLPDRSFAPIISSEISSRSFATDREGRLLIAFGGYGEPSIPNRPLTRLNIDGSTDESFTPTFSQPDGTLVWLSPPAVQPEGKILISGNFRAVNGRPRSGLVRLHADGSTDETFTFAEYPTPIDSILALPDGTILTAGFYSGVQHISSAGALLKAIPVRTSERPCYRPIVEIVSGSPEAVILRGQAFYPRPCAFVNLVRVGLTNAPLTELQLGDCGGNYESSMSSTISVVRLGDVTAPARFSYVTRNGTALAGSDYESLQGEVVFQPFQHEALILIPIRNDRTSEDDETFELVVTSAEGFERFPRQVTVHILDDDLEIIPGSIQRHSSGAVEFTYRPAGGVVEYSTDLRTWLRGVQSTEFLEGNRLRVLDAGATNQPQRFYRVVPYTRTQSMRIHPDC